MADPADTSIARLFPDIEPGSVVTHVERDRLPNGEDEPSLPAVSAPDMALQVTPCLDVFSQLLGVDLGTELVAALSAEFGPDVRRRCAARPGFNRPVETIAVWSTPATGAAAGAARDRGLAAVSALQPDRPFAFFFGRTLMRRLLSDSFANMPSHRFDSSGDPDPDGPIHLTGISTALEPPDTVQTVLSGFDDRPFPDVDFRITVRDKLSADRGHLTCTTTRDLDTDTGLLNFLAVITAPLLVFVIERIVVELKTETPSSTSADCWVAALAREEVPVSGGKKVLLAYGDVEVTSAGLVLNAPAGGLPSVVGREPTVEILGRRSLLDRHGLGSARATYTVATDDLRGRIRYSWTLDGAALPGTAASVQVTLAAPPGTTRTRRLAVSARDVDGLRAQDELTVTVTSRVPGGGQTPGGPPGGQIP